MTKPKALTACRTCTFIEADHGVHADACEHFLPRLQPWVHLPDFKPQPDRGGQDWHFYDPEAQTILLIIPKEGWTFCFRLLYREGTFPISELRIYPTEPAMIDFSPPGEWTHDADHLPDGGLTVDQVRSTPFREARQEIGKVLKEMQAKLGDTDFGEQLRSRELPDDLLRRLRRPPRRNLSVRDEQLRVAAIYVATVNGGWPKPRVKVAQWLGHGLTPERVGNILHEARRNGYLTKAQHGRAGGELTELAMTLLQDLGRREQKAP